MKKKELDFCDPPPLSLVPCPPPPPFFFRFDGKPFFLSKLKRPGAPCPFYPLFSFDFRRNLFFLNRVNAGGAGGRGLMFNNNKKVHGRKLG